MSQRYESPLDLPVVVMTYNRPEHTREVIRALRLHGVTNLTIYSDAPKTPEHNLSVKATQDLIRTIDWTTPSIFIQEANQGLAKSITSAVDRSFEKEDFVILLEDDCVPKRWFFQYMFEVYRRYQNSDRIYGASGYTVQLPREILSSYPHDVYFVPRIGSWGWATWKNKWQVNEPDLVALLKQCESNAVNFEQGGSDIIQTIQGMLNGSVRDVWTINWLLSVYLKRGFFAYPTVSHIRNIGMDGSGVHCGPTSKFETEIASLQPRRFPKDVVLDRNIYSAFRKYYDVPNRQNHEADFRRLEGEINSSERARSPLISKNIAPTITHVVEELSLGGAGRALLACTKYTRNLGSYQHRVISLLPISQPAVLEYAKELGIEVVVPDNDTVRYSYLENSDIIQLHWWNSPYLEEFVRNPLPPCRLLAWFHIGGHTPPQRLSEEIVDFVDIAVPCSPYTLESPALANLSPATRLQKVKMAYGCADFERLKNFTPDEHSGFRVGYIGTLNFMKMHPDFVEMCSMVKEPQIEFHLWGQGGAEQILQVQAHKFSCKDRFFFHGYVKEVATALAEIDVFGYPLCEDTYAASELVLQEVMFAGIVPVVFPHGGIRNLVVDNFTGLVVRSKEEYAQAIEYLYRNPEERARLSRNAREYAKQIFGAEPAAQVFHGIYQSLLKIEKRPREWITSSKFAALLPPQLLNSGAGIFCQALGFDTKPFLTSLKGTDLDQILHAEEQIIHVSSLLRSGGIDVYRNFYDRDPYLAFWSGLAAYGAHNIQQAICEFARAIELKFPHWRVVWYLARAYEAGGFSKEAAEAFSLAKELSSSVELPILNLHSRS